MNFSKLLSLVSVTSLSLLSACATYHSPEDVRMSGDYWQRKDSTSALYLTGPKAQHTLHNDIASCVAQVRELSRLGSIRKATPPNDIAMTGAMKSYWDTPLRDGPNHTEYVTFHDFEGCMDYHGWQRVGYVTPERAKQATYNYADTILGYELPQMWGQEQRHRNSSNLGNNNNQFNN
jgi:hypothetical protein